MKLNILLCSIAFAGALALRAQTSSTEPNDRGPIKLLTASWLGGALDDEIVGATVVADGTIFLALNAAEATWPGVKPSPLGEAGELPPAEPAPKPKNPPKPGPQDQPGYAGALVHLSKDGRQVLGVVQLPPGAGFWRTLRYGEAEGLFALGDARRPLTLGGVTGTGTFVAHFSPDGRQVKPAFFQPDLLDFGVDRGGEVVLLTKGRLLRRRPGVADPIWEAAIPATGDNRPGGVDVSAETGMAVVTGYGMTKTGHEPYKDPYAHGFDRAGKLAWTLWNPDPTQQAGTQYGGTGLMADTTGMFCRAGAAGKIYVALRANGGNTVTTRDPADARQKLDPAVLAGVFQNGPGFGFKGASMTSVIFRADALTGKLEKGTFLCSWLTPQRANGLMIKDVASANAYQFVVGGSASGFRTKEPWYEAPPGGYKGGGFLAAFDGGFKMVQAGYFPGTDIRCVAARCGTIIIAGSAEAEVKSSDKSVPDAPEFTYAVPQFHPPQAGYGGGRKDGFFAVFQTKD